MLSRIFANWTLSSNCRPISQGYQHYLSLLSKRPGKYEDALKYCVTIIPQCACVVLRLGMPKTYSKASLDFKSTLWVQKQLRSCHQLFPAEIPANRGSSVASNPSISPPVRPCILLCCSFFLFAVLPWPSERLSCNFFADRCPCSPHVIAAMGHKCSCCLY